MPNKRDYYEVLGVARDSSADEIRKAYRQCALKHHPDRNPGDKAAEEKFKEATEAFSVLSDQSKRAQYDRFGHADMGGFDFSSAGMGDILSHFQDMFSDFFGGFSGGGFGGASRRRGPERGPDVRIDATLTLKEAMTGCKREVQVHGTAPCETCGGSGARPGTKPETCHECGGVGQVTTQRGFIMFSTTCPRCHGSGQFVADRCKACAGGGQVEKQRRVLVNFPAGIDSGQRLRVPSQGMPGPNGAQPGDLYVDVEVEGDPRFERAGYDLGVHRPISFAEAALGTQITVELPDGKEITAEVKPGTQPGTIVVVSGAGMPRLDRHGRGDLHIGIDVQVPTKLSKHAKKLLMELDEELNTSSEPKASTG